MSEMEWVLKWLNRANNDLLVAQHIFDSLHPKQLEICCYQCQQSAEKALKAFLTFKQYNFPLTHDLGQLCRLCIAFDGSFKERVNDCIELNPYATQARYPNNDSDIDEMETKAALHKAERILALCTKLITSEAY